MSETFYLFAQQHNNMANVAPLSVEPRTEGTIEWDEVFAMDGTADIAGTGEIPLIFDNATYEESESIWDAFGISNRTRSAPISMLIREDGVSAPEAYNAYAKYIPPQRGQGYWETLRVLIYDIEPLA